MPSHVHIAVCCPVSATRIFEKTYYLIERIHADITHKTLILNTCSIAIAPVPIADNRACFSFVMSICPSVRPHESTQLPLDEFSRNFTLENFSKICRENSSFIKIGKK
jgi:hypothetical protein